MKRHARSDRAVTGRLSSVLLVVVVVAFAGYVYVTNHDKADDASVVVTEPVNAESARPAFIPVANVDATPVESMHPIGHVVAGDTVGLYGGTTINACDAAQIDAYLHANPLLANAWARALRIGPDEIHPYLGSLTALVLRTDTVVTNHGYEHGVATPFRSVLQAGTAVLVDAEGLPRVRCRCGNPLQTAAPPQQDVRYVGQAWKGFEPESVTAISPAPKEVKDFVVVDHDNKVKFRPRATRGAEDRDVDPHVATLAYHSLSANGTSTTGGSSHGDGLTTGSSTGTAISTADATTLLTATNSPDLTATVAPTSTATATATATAVVATGTAGPTTAEATPAPDGNATNTAVVPEPTESPNTVKPPVVSPESHSQPPGNETEHQGSGQQSGNQQSGSQESGNQQPEGQ